MNITYLLGAGASFNALPIVDKIPQELQNFADEFKPVLNFDLVYNSHEEKNIVTSFLEKFNYNRDSKEFWTKSAEQFYNDINWLNREAKNHTSIDTLAKKLFLRRDEKKLNKLKSILSCFFIFIQTKKNDNRYDSFFASILEDLNNLPKNIKILSWNYDSQLENAFSNFSNEPLNLCRNSLNLQSKGEFSLVDYNVDEFSIHKINGTTNIKSKHYKVKEIISDFKSDSDNLVETFLNTHNSVIGELYKPTLSFAWEAYNAGNKFFEILKKVVSKTDILIVIGYSFPFFNRNIDRDILDAMTNLKKVYVQDPNFSKDIIEKIKGLIPRHETNFEGIKVKNIDFVEKSFVDQFYIPIEF